MRKGCVLGLFFFQVLFTSLVALATDAVPCVQPLSLSGSFVGVSENESAEIAASLNPILKAPIFSRALVHVLTREFNVPQFSVELALQRFANTSPEQQMKLIDAVIAYFSERIKDVNDWSDLADIGTLAPQVGVTHFAAYQALSEGWAHWARGEESQRQLLQQFLRLQTLALYKNPKANDALLVWIDPFSTRQSVQFLSTGKQSVEKAPVVVASTGGSGSIHPTALAITSLTKATASTTQLGVWKRFVRALANTFGIKRADTDLEIEVIDAEFVDASDAAEFEAQQGVRVVDPEMVFSSDAQELQWLNKELYVLNNQLRFVNHEIAVEGSGLKKAWREMRDFRDVIEGERKDKFNKRAPLMRFVKPMLEIVRKHKKSVTADEFVEMVENAVINFSTTSSYYWSEPVLPAFLEFYKGLQEESSEVFFESKEQVERIVAFLERYADGHYEDFKTERAIREVLLFSQWGAPPTLNPNISGIAVMEEKQLSEFEQKRIQLREKVQSIENRIRLIERRKPKLRVEPQSTETAEEIEAQAVEEQQVEASEEKQKR